MVWFSFLVPIFKTMHVGSIVCLINRTNGKKRKEKKNSNESGIQCQISMANFCTLVASADCVNEC